MVKLALLVVFAGLLATVINAAGDPNKTDIPPNYVLIRPGQFGKRVFAASCQDPKKKLTGCDTTCPAKCPDECLVFCPTCKTLCLCELPRNVCGDPRFNGGDGNTFYFHGRKNEDFCIVSDSNLHVNAHFIGKRNPAISRDFTWVQALGILFDTHRLYIGVQKTVTYDDDVDRLNISFDDKQIFIPTEPNAKWVSDSVPALSISRRKATNSVILELEGKLEIMAKAVRITEEDSRIHKYGVGPDNHLAHLDLGFRFYSLGDDVHGVLGQTYRPDYVNKMVVRKKVPVMGGAHKYISSNIFGTDCRVSRFGHDGVGSSVV